MSERKAQRFQRELQVAKDEALRMLLRLKQMMDSMITEAELTSLNQWKKIEELEAQLQEAKDIVKDLREELREVQSELEWVRSNKVQHPYSVLLIWIFLLSLVVDGITGVHMEEDAGKLLHTGRFE